MINSLTDQIKLLQRHTKNIRNICVLAHVDHGKTSLVDSLISYNNIINPKLAGLMRYMDTRPDEQERCITMKSSAISIVYDSVKLKECYLINLIDSPGHVDFSSEIFSALKICDGALILIDVVEGVCSQTISVIKQAWDEKIKCILVFNKIDRLILSLKMDPLETYLHLCRLLETVNSLMGSLIVRDINIDLEQKSKNATENEASNQTNEDIDLDLLIQEKENELHFSPEKGNVIFASAIDCWAFSIESFADILCSKLGFKKEALVKLLWGDFFLNPKTKKVSNVPFSEKSRPMFVELVLNNIYKLYNIVIEERNQESVLKACKSLNITLTKNDMNCLEKDKDSRPLLKTIMRQWLAIPNNIFDCIVNKLPEPFKSIQQGKFDVVFPKYRSLINKNQFFGVVQKLMETGSSENNTVIGFISKMIAVPRRFIGDEVIGPEEDGNEVRFMAFARLYTGSIKKGNDLYIIGPKHNPQDNHYDIKKIKFDRLYLFLGQYLEPVDELHPGCIFSLGGLENYVIKTATISNCFDCPSIIPRNINKNSIIKVSIIANDIKDMPALVEGLKKLNKSDPAVDYYVQENGEHILVTSGEVHLERCVKDLEDQLAKVKFKKISESIVNFKEGLYNKVYSFKKSKFDKKTKTKEKQFEVVDKRERKQYLIRDEYEVVEGDQNLEERYQKLMDIQNKKKNKKVEKLKDKKVDDIRHIAERKDIFLEKNIQIKNESFSFAIDITPNKLCEIVVSAVGMDYPPINYLEKNETFLKEFLISNDGSSEEIKTNFLKFKTNFLALFENDKKLKSLLENNTFSFGPNNTGPNILIVRDLPKQFSFFHIYDCTNESSVNPEQEKKVNDDKKTPTKKEKVVRNLEEEISKGLNDHISLKEFLNAIKAGFDLVLENGPLCEENCYGVIFVLEDFKFINEYLSFNPREKPKVPKTEEKVIESKSDKVEETKENTAKEAESTEVIEMINTNIPKYDNEQKHINSPKKEGSITESLSVHSLKTTSVSKVDNNKVNKKDISDDLSEISGKQSGSTYGPFLGQLIGTMKSCSRQAFLNGQPRLYEAIYLCLFQIKQENIGSIHSVINKRRGHIIDEKPNDEGNICTIEAHIPVAESFHFVEEIRIKSSGLANTMLQFDHWKMIDDDPFLLTKAPESEDFGTQIVTPNVAKKYIDKIRERKGLPIDRKIVIDANKQRNLSKKN